MSNDEPIYDDWTGNPAPAPVLATHEPPMTEDRPERTQWIVIVGAKSWAKCHGLFGSHDDAVKWCNANQFDVLREIYPVQVAAVPVAPLRDEGLTTEAARIIADELTCRRCGTAAYQPNDRCEFHLSNKQRADACEDWAQRSAAWEKRAYQVEAEIAALRATANERDLLFSVVPGWLRVQAIAFHSRYGQGEWTPDCTTCSACHAYRRYCAWMQRESKPMAAPLRATEELDLGPMLEVMADELERLPAAQLDDRRAKLVSIPRFVAGRITELRAALLRWLG